MTSRVIAACIVALGVIFVVQVALSDCSCYCGDCEAAVEWASATRTVASGSEVTLEFRTAADASCRLYILYEGTGNCARIGEGEGWHIADQEGNVAWSWDTEAQEQPATALVRVAEDSGESWHSFDFFIEAAEPEIDG